MKTIPLSRGLFSIVDDEDFEWVNQWKWSCTASGYAVRLLRVGERPECKTRLVYLHREIFNDSTVKIVDHVNQDPKDNRRCNLRPATKSQNMMNKGRRSDNKSGHKGVYFDRRRLKWNVEIKRDKKKYFIGSFKNLEDAVSAHTNAVIEIHGAFAFVEKE